MKIILTEKQINKVLRGLIYEDDYSIHIGELPTNLKPYGGGTDSLYRMSGRDTGHFGSGTYFSTYKDINNDLYDKFILNKNYDKSFNKVENKIYVIDLDSYKLYKPMNKNNAEFLFKTLKLINQFFYSVCSLNYMGSTYDGLNDNSKNKLKIILNNLKYLKLKLPPYKNFIELVKNLCTSEKNDDITIPPLATIIMEYNGYNGVNVNNIDGWDNTLHGSVIYDLNKLDKNEEKQNIDTFNYKIDKNDKIVNKFHKDSFYKNIKLNTSILTVNSLVNLLDKPLEQIDWLMLEDKLSKKEITNEIFNHIKKVYSLKLKKLISNGIDTKDLTEYDILLLLRMVNFDYVLNNLDIDEIFYKISKYNLYKDKYVKNFIDSVDKTKLEDTYYYDKIIDYL